MSSAYRETETNAFAEWVQNEYPEPPFSAYGASLVEAGVSGDTVLSTPAEQLEVEFRECGVPRFPARDIVIAAKTFFENQRRVREIPMAVFWDVARVPPPPSSVLKGREVIQRLRGSLSSYGPIDFINAYMDTHDRVEEGQRSDFQLCGVNLRLLGATRESTVESLSVDVMKFVLDKHPNSVSVCIISDPTSFEYLRSTLRRSNIVAVLITARSLTATAAITQPPFMRWETDVLKSDAVAVGLSVRTLPGSTAAGDQLALITHPVSCHDAEKEPTTAATSDMGSRENTAIFHTDGEETHQVVVDSSEPVSATDRTLDDICVLERIMLRFRDEGNVTPFRGFVGSKLKEWNPSAFGTSQRRKEVLDRACETICVACTAPNGAAAMRLRQHREGADAIDQWEREATRPVEHADQKRTIYQNTGLYGHPNAVARERPFALCFPRLIVRPFAELPRQFAFICVSGDLYFILFQSELLREQFITTHIESNASFDWLRGKWFLWDLRQRRPAGK